MNAVVSVIGKDRSGIIAAVAGELAKLDINVLDISQTLMHGNFVMVMLADLSAASVDINELSALLNNAVAGFQVAVHVQHEDLFNAMQRV